MLFSIINRVNSEIKIKIPSALQEPGSGTYIVKEGRGYQALKLDEKNIFKMADGTLMDKTKCLKIAQHFTIRCILLSY